MAPRALRHVRDPPLMSLISSLITTVNQFGETFAAASATKSLYITIAHAKLKSN